MRTLLLLFLAVGCATEGGSERAQESAMLRGYYVQITDATAARAADKTYQACARQEPVSNPCVNYIHAVDGRVESAVREHQEAERRVASHWAAQDEADHQRRVRATVLAVQAAGAGLQVYGQTLQMQRPVVTTCNSIGGNTTCVSQ